MRCPGSSTKVMVYMNTLLIPKFLLTPSTLTVVLSEEEAALLGRCRLLPPMQRERLKTIASGAHWTLDDGLSGPRALTL